MLHVAAMAFLDDGFCFGIMTGVGRRNDAGIKPQTTRVETIPLTFSPLEQTVSFDVSSYDKK
jgi:hypothetical protein